MKAAIGNRVIVTRYISKEIDTSIGEITGKEILHGTITDAKIIPGGYTDGREYVSTFIEFDNGGCQMTGDIDEAEYGYPVISIVAE